MELSQESIPGCIVERRVFSLLCHSPTLRASVLYKQSILCIFFNFSLFVLFQNKQNHKIVFGYSVVDVFSTELFGSESSLLYEY